jgi:tyrosyl-tRNA synthetase
VTARRQKPPRPKKAPSRARKARDFGPDIEDILRRGVIQIVPEEEFLEALRSGRSLRLKLGLDPSKPDLHIGHGVLLRKLRKLQELGHQVVLIVGDWTAQIGDPSGQSVMRPMLTAGEVRANAETYMRQFFHVVDKQKTEVRWQSEWFGSFTLADVMRLAARFTVAQMLQREDFRQRFDAHQPLGIHELLYPLLQAYDSVAIEADVEFGGSDQLFNLLVGRELQEAVGQRPQSCFVMHLLPGTDGAQKMSKSLGNTVDFEDPPGEKYGKLMSIPDAAVMTYLELATDVPDEELAYLRKQLASGGAQAMAVKKRLAREVVAQFHGQRAAREAEAEWARTFQQRELPEEVEEVSVAKRALDGGLAVDVPSLLTDAGLAASKAEARRLIRQGAVEVGGRKLTPEEAGDLVVPDRTVLRVGKHRFLRIVAAGPDTTS